MSGAHSPLSTSSRVLSARICPVAQIEAGIAARALSRPKIAINPYLGFFILICDVDCQLKQCIAQFQILLNKLIIQSHKPPSLVLMICPNGRSFPTKKIEPLLLTS